MEHGWNSELDQEVTARDKCSWNHKSASILRNPTFRMAVTAEQRVAELETLASQLQEKISAVESQKLLNGSSHRNAAES